MKRKKKAPRSARRLWLTLMVLISLGAATYFIFFDKHSNLKPTHTSSVSRSHRPSSGSAPNIPSGNLSEPLRGMPKIKDLPRTDGKPFVAIVIDDMGYYESTGDKILALNLNLSFAFLPFAPHTSKQAAIAHHLGRDILLHLPMEPADRKWKPEAGTLFLNMNPGQLGETFRKDLAAVPMAIGVNNHMGSRFTEDRAAMKTFLQYLRANNLFFLDSLTSSNSLGYSLSKEMGVEVIRRDIFLDNDQSKDKIISQINKLMLIAKKEGIAVGIAHPHEETLMALVEYQDRFNQQVNLVGIHYLIGLDE